MYLLLLLQSIIKSNEYHQNNTLYLTNRIFIYFFNRKDCLKVLVYFRWFLCSIIVLCTLAVSAQVKFERAWYYTTADTVVFKDIDKKPFQQLTNSLHNPPLYNNGVYWFRLDIQNPHPEKDLIIGIKNPHLDTVVLYQYRNNEIVPTDTLGNNFKAKNSTYLRYVRFRVEGNTTTLWLKTRLKKEILFPVTVDTVTDFYHAESISFLKLGIYYGIALIVLIVNITLYFSFREPKFLYYSALLFLTMALYAYADGLYALVSYNPIWLNYASLPIMLGVSVGTVVFSIKFLELDSCYKWLYRISATLLVLMGFCFSTYIIFNWTVACILGNMILPLLLTLYWLVALSRFKRYTEARFFVFASALSLLLVLNFFVFRFIGLNFLSVMPSELKLGNLIQMFILSIGILYQVKILHKEHTFYREEIQRYLSKQPTKPQEEILQEQDTFIQLQQQFGLSEREMEVLKLLAEGLTNQQIGEKLFLSPNTIKTHIKNLYLKLNISNRAQAVNKLYEV